MALLQPEIEPMIGLSLSFCIKDIMHGNVAEGEVTKIITSTACRTEADWDRLIAGYRQTYWRAFEGAAVAELIQRLRALGKIEQPRLADPEHEHHINNGHWRSDAAA